MEFRLLSTTSNTSARPSIAIEGEWCLTEPIDTHSDEFPRYTCISYVWGTGRAANPIHPAYPMSDRTLPVLAAAMRNHEPTSYWIDAFCVPPTPGVRRATLESMGFIYGHATDVVVVLSGKGFAALERICAWDAKTTPQPDGRPLGDLEVDMWIRSAWAYQEVVNSASLWFAGEGVDRGLLRDEDVLNKLGHYFVTYERNNQLTSREMRIRYPHLDALEELLLDWRTGQFAQRSALQVMSGMSRDNFNWRDYKSALYSMIGAITQEPSSRTASPTLESLSETFMSLCEKKGDLSFIFSSADRDDRAGYRWRPRPGLLPSILPWHCFGEEQPIRRDAQGIWLRHITIVTQSPTIESAGRQVISRWFGDPDLATAPEAEIIGRASSALADMGFSGTDEAVVSANGLLYPQCSLSAERPFRICVATSLRWSGDFAAPALVLVAAADHTQYVPGVFVGAVPRGTSEVLLEI